MSIYERVACRHTEIEDLLELDAIRDILKTTNGTCGLADGTPLSTIMAYATLCVTATEPQSGKVVGGIAFFASGLLDNVLPKKDDGALGRWVADQASNLRVQAPAGLVVPYFVLHPDHEEAALVNILGFAFSVSPSLTRVLLVSKQAVPLSQPYLLSYCTSLNATGPDGAAAYKATRAAICPILNARIAKVEDNDDLLPIVEGSKHLYGSLAQVPSANGGPCLLADFLANPPQATTAIVAEDPSTFARALIAINTDVNCTVLLHHFDLSAYDGLIEPEQYERLVAAAEAELAAERQAEADKKHAALLEEAAAEARAAAEQEEAFAAADAEVERMSMLAPAASADSANAATAAADDAAAAGDKTAADAGLRSAPSDLLRAAGSAVADGGMPGEEASCEGAIGEGAKGAARAGGVPPVEPKPYTAAEVQERVARAAARAPVAPRSTCMALMMLCMDAGWHGRAGDVVRSVFQAYPQCDWVAATLPAEEQPPDALAAFDCLAPLPWSPFPAKLYLLHREALSQLVVHAACAVDRPGVEALLAGLPDADAQLAAFDAAVDASLAAVATFADSVVGVVALSADVDVPSVAREYALSAVVDPPKYPPAAYARLSSCIMNPIFSPQARDVLATALALLQRPVALAAPAAAAAAFPAGGPLLDVPAAAGASPPPLLAAAPPLTHRRKATLDVRVVVVGASETALAALRAVALRRDAALPHVTLLAPLGAEAAPALLHPQLGAVLHDPAVTVVDASMVALDRQARQIELDDGSTLRYDLLVLAPGLQNATLCAVKAGGVSGVCSTAELQRHLTAADADEVQGALVYGDTLAAVTALATLEERGVNVARAALHLAPPGPPGPGMDILREMAAEYGMPLERPRMATLTQLEASEDQQSFRCFFDTHDDSAGGGEGGLSLETDLMVAAEAPDTAPDMMALLADAGLVYDGRLVVDAAMRCAGDTRILAAGPIAKLSRAVGGERLEAFAAADVGAALADRLLLAAAGLLRAPPPASTDAAAAAAAAGDPPRFAAAAAQGAALSGGARFALAKAPAAAAAAHSAADAVAFAAPVAGYVVQTHTPRGLCKLALDAHDTIVQAAYVGREAAITPELLSALMNMPAALLCPELHQSIGSGNVPCLVELLLSPWLRPALTGGFRSLMDAFVESLLDVMRECGDTRGHHRPTQLALLDCQDGAIKYAADVSQQAPLVAPA
eukprot:jgi/Ulvmu1/2774/UM140_0003.1